LEAFKMDGSGLPVMAGKPMLQVPLVYTQRVAATFSINDLLHHAFLCVHSASW
jgi:hypothetical protein